MGIMLGRNRESAKQRLLAPPGRAGENIHGLPDEMTYHPRFGPGTMRSGPGKNLSYYGKEER
jgi:hypothetical protein